MEDNDNGKWTDVMQYSIYNTFSNKRASFYLANHITLVQIPINTTRSIKIFVEFDDYISSGTLSENIVSVSP